MLMSPAPWEISESDTVSLNDNNRLGVPKRHRFKTHGLFDMESKNEGFQGISYSFWCHSQVLC